MQKYLLRRGNSKDFESYKTKMPIGEMCALLDKRTICFCFGNGDIQELKFDENVTNEKADELINAIQSFIANQFENK